MKFLKIYESDNSLSNHQCKVDDEVFFKFRRYDYYLDDKEIYRNVYHKRYVYNKFTNEVELETVKDRVYLKREISDYFYKEYTGFKSAFKITFKNKDCLDLRIKNFIFQDMSSYNHLYWWPEKSHLNPNIYC